MRESRKARYLEPTEVTRRKKILNKIINIFEKYKYQEIVTPTFEAYENLKAGLPEELKEASYNFFDHQGRHLILRPDLTTQIARFVATEMTAIKGPIRLYYSSDVYRAKQLEIGQGNQFHQIGVELFDVPSTKGDAEIVKIVKESLAAIGLKNYEIAQTDINKIKKLTSKEKAALRQQDFVTFGRLPNKEELMFLDIDYYTGLYFECFVPEIGYVLGSGGRYDNLTGQFGKKRQAVGFAFDFDKLILALNAQTAG